MPDAIRCDDAAAPLDGRRKYRAPLWVQPLIVVSAELKE